MAEVIEHSASGTWLKTGYKAMHAEIERREQAYGPDRFWIPPNESREVVYLDDEPRQLDEHQVRIGTSWRNWFTCLKQTGAEAVCCELAGIRSKNWVGYYSIVDLSLWKDKAGNEHQYELKLFGAKSETLKRLELKSNDRKRDNPNGLAGCMYRVSRVAKGSSNTGDDFEFKKEVDPRKMFDFVTFKGKKLADLFRAAEEKPEEMEKLKRLFALEFDGNGKLIHKVPVFNYQEVLKPKTPRELREILSGIKVDNDSEAKGDGSSAPQVPDVPF